MTRSDLSGFFSFTISPTNVSTICHGTPYLSLVHPYCSMAPPADSRSHNASTSPCVSQFAHVRESIAVTPRSPRMRRIWTSALARSTLSSCRPSGVRSRKVQTPPRRSRPRSFVIYDLHFRLPFRKKNAQPIYLALVSPGAEISIEVHAARVLPAHRAAFRVTMHRILRGGGEKTTARSDIKLTVHETP